MARVRATLVLALVPAALPALAGTPVVFTDGRAMEVEDVQRVDGAARLVLEGGGVLAVPEQRIANWEEIARDLEARRAEAERARQTAALHEPRSRSKAPWRDVAGPYADLIERSSARHALDPALLTAMAEVESAFDPRAVSPKGACGLLQLMPDTADRFGVSDVFDAEQNVDGGARYLSWLLRRYDGRTDLALAGYNAGEGAVDRHSGVPPYRETRHYVRQVLEGAARLADLAP